MKTLRNQETNRSSGVVCDFCDEYILLKTFKTIEGWHICSSCEKIAKEILEKEKSINTKELMKICKK